MVETKNEPGIFLENPLNSFVSDLSEVSGYDTDELVLGLLINVSRNLGRFVTCLKLPILQPRANLFGIIVAPPEEFHKSSLIRWEDDLTESIIQNLKDRIQNGDYEQPLPDNFPHFVSRTFDGSPEGLVDLLVLSEGLHFKAPELGVKLKLQNVARYDTGNIEMLNNLYYGEAVDRNVKKSPVHIPKGRYVTLFGDLHPDELTPQTLKLGLLRRCIIVKKNYKDIDPAKVNRAYELDNNEKFQNLLDDYKNLVAKTILNFFLKVERTEAIITEEALNFLEDINQSAVVRVKEEEIPRYPNENAELILRVAINLLLYEYAMVTQQYEGYFELKVEKKHTQWALDFMAKITENYKTEIGRFEEPDILVKYEKMSNKINEHFKKTNKGMNAWTAQKSFNWTNKMSKVEFRKFMENLTSREMAKEEVENVNGKAVSFYYPFEESIS